MKSICQRKDGCGGERKERASIKSVALRHSAAASLTDSLTADCLCWLTGWLAGWMQQCPHSFALVSAPPPPSTPRVYLPPSVSQHCSSDFAQMRQNTCDFYFLFTPK